MTPVKNNLTVKDHTALLGNQIPQICDKLCTGMFQLLRQLRIGIH
mgnify:CR=1 FL=1